VEEVTPRPPVLSADERFALMQLCSNAYLACGRLSDTACGDLARSGLAWKDRDGFWSATDKGRHVFRNLGGEKCVLPVDDVSV
jgi:hypothetical protein